MTLNLSSVTQSQYKPRPIETIYNGYRFRSRLEARWAVFFDALDIPYEYEKEGYELGNNVRYLPDFYMSTWDKFVEIKPRKKLEPDELRKVGLLVQRSDKPVILIIGEPWPGDYIALPFVPAHGMQYKKVLVTYPSKDWNRSCFAFGEYTRQMYLVLQSEDQLQKQEQPPLQNVLTLSEDFWTWDGQLLGLIAGPDSRNPAGPPLMADYETAGIHVITGKVPNLTKHPFALSRAYVSARQARFEHGETPDGRIQD